MDKPWKTLSKSEGQKTRLAAFRVSFDPATTSVEIKNLRNRMGLLLRDFARQLGANKWEMTQVEHGTRDNLTRRVAKRIQALHNAAQHIKLEDAHKIIPLYRKLMRKEINSTMKREFETLLKGMRHFAKADAKKPNTVFSGVKIKMWISLETNELGKEVKSIVREYNLIDLPPEALKMLRGRFKDAADYVKKEGEDGTQKVS